MRNAGEIAGESQTRIAGATLAILAGAARRKIFIFC